MHPGSRIDNDGAGLFFVLTLAFTLSLLVPLSMPAQIIQTVLFPAAVLSLVMKMRASRRAVKVLEA